MKFGDYVKVKSLQTPENFKKNLHDLGIHMPFDEVLESGPSSVMAQPLQIGSLKVGNRFAIHPFRAFVVGVDLRERERRRRAAAMSGGGSKSTKGREECVRKLTQFSETCYLFRSRGVDLRALCVQKVFQAPAAG